MTLYEKTDIELTDMADKCYDMHESTNDESYFDLACEISDLAEWRHLVGTEADTMTFGEFTRRCNRSLSIVNEILERGVAI